MAQKTEGTFIPKQNLIAALSLAIEARRIDEKRMGFTSDSGMIRGWESNLKVLISGDEITIRY